MKFPSIRIEGAILAADILDKIETGDVIGQKPADFGLASDAKVKDEIVRAWTDAQDLWRIFRRKLDGLKPEATATSETRNFFVVPLLGLLGYQIELAGKGEFVNDKNYPISHRVPSRDDFPVHIMGWCGFRRCRTPVLIPVGQHSNPVGQKSERSDVLGK
jgi:hypothetical protein